MKNKLINIKNFLRIVISLMVIFAYAKSCAKAITYEDIKTYANDTADYFPNNTYYQTIKNNVNKTQFETEINSMNISSYTEFYLTYHEYPTRTSVLFTCFTPESWIINSNGVFFKGYYKTASININSNGTGKNDTATYNNGQSVINYAGFYNNTANQENSLMGMIYTSTDLSQSYTLPATFVGLQAVAPQVNIYFGHMFSEEITYNGEEMQANELDYNYRIEFIENVVTEDNEITSMVATLDSKALEVQDMGGYWTIKENNSTTLKYNQIYVLNVKAIVNDNEEEIEEKVIFVPPGTTISGGVITNIPSGDFNFNTENATNQIIENINNLNNALESGNQEIINNINNSSEVENIMTETLSGDIETISSDLGFSALDNPFTSFLFFVLEGVYDVLTDREDMVLTTNYKSLEFNLASTDFITPQSELKTFIRNMLICVYIYGNYKWFHYMITLLETARINKFMAEIGTDEFYDTDIM